MCPPWKHCLKIFEVQSASLRNATSSTDGPAELESIEPTDWLSRAAPETLATVAIIGVQVI